MSTHVEWTSIAERAEACGLQVKGFTDQHHLITGILSELGRGGSPEPPRRNCGQSPVPSAKTKRALQTLRHPEMLGRSSQVLPVAKDLDLAGPFAGFKFTR